MIKKLRVTLFATLILMAASVFAAPIASAHIYTNGTIRLGCSQSWSKDDDVTHFEIRATCSSTGIYLAYGWYLRDRYWSQVNSNDSGFKWKFSNGQGGGGKQYPIGSGYQVHGSFKIPDNNSVHLTDSATFTNIDFGQKFSAVIADFSVGTNPCYGGKCPVRIDT